MMLKRNKMSVGISRKISNIPYIYVNTTVVGKPNMYLKNINDDGLLSNSKHSSILEILNSLNEFKDKLGPEYGLDETLEQLKTTMKDVENKNLEMKILSYFSFHAEDENIVELRKQLFLQTKLMYQDRIESIITYIRENADYEVSCGPSNPTTAISDKNKNGLLYDLLHGWMNIFHRVRTVIKQKDKS